MNFDTAFERLIGHEGRYVNHPDDPGGETNWGISKKSHPYLDIKSLTIDDAKEIYYRDYWSKFSGDILYPSVAFQMFDIAVNSGVKTAIKLLQRAVGVRDDGVLGPVTIGALLKIPEANQLLLLNAERLEYMTDLYIWGTFGKGWARRVAGNLKYASTDLPQD